MGEMSNVQPELQSESTFMVNQTLQITKIVTQHKHPPTSAAATTPPPKLPKWSSLSKRLTLNRQLTNLASLSTPPVPPTNKLSPLAVPIPDFRLMAKTSNSSTRSVTPVPLLSVKVVLFI